MTNHALVLAGVLTVLMGSAVDAQERTQNLQRLVSALDLSARGVVRWLQRLDPSEAGPAERVLAVTPEGETLAECDGGRSSVRIDPDLDRLLLRPGRTVVLIHNHPSNVGLSAADLEQLAKPGVAAIVAIGHDRSFYVAAPGTRTAPEFVLERQQSLAQAETAWRLQSVVPMQVSMRHRDALFNHLVCRVLAKAGIIEYWFELRGLNLEAYETARMVLGQVVEGAARRFKP